MNKVYLQLNEPGTGEIDIPLDTAPAANINVGGWVNLDYKGLLLPFRVENVDKTLVSSSENAGRVISATGRGPMSVLDDAVEWLSLIHI